MLPTLSYQFLMMGIYKENKKNKNDFIFIFIEMTDKISKEAFEYLNQIRANPKAAVAPLQEQLALFKGKILNIKGEIPLQTQEGADAVKGIQLT